MSIPLAPELAIPVPKFTLPLGGAASPVTSLVATRTSAPLALFNEAAPPMPDEETPVFTLTSLPAAPPAPALTLMFPPDPDSEVPAKISMRPPVPAIASPPLTRMMPGLSPFVLKVTLPDEVAVALPEISVTEPDTADAAAVSPEPRKMDPESSLDAGTVTMSMLG